MTVDHFLATAADNQPVAGISKNTIAQWRGANGSDFAAAIDPLSNLANVRFHSGLDYLRVAKVVQSTDAGRAAVNLPSMGEGLVFNQQTLLFAHGMGYPPLMICDTTIGGYAYTCNGSSMVLSGGATHDPRWVGFTSDDTNIYMHAFGFMGAASTVHWRVHVLAEQFQVTSDLGDLLRFNPNELVAPKIGKIDPDHRFVRKVASGGQFRFAGVQTLKFDVQNGWTAINFSDGVTDAAAATVNVTPWPVGHYHANSVACEV